MDVQKVITGEVTKKPQTKGQKAAERMQKEYLYQLQQGKSSKQSLLESLKALDDKFQPECDCYECASRDGVYAKMHLPDRKTISKVLDFIVKVGPILYELLNQIWDLIPAKNDKNENDKKCESAEKAMVRYSTTA